MKLFIISFKFKHLNTLKTKKFAYEIEKKDKFPCKFPLCFQNCRYFYQKEGYNLIPIIVDQMDLHLDLSKQVSVINCRTATLQFTLSGYM